MEAEKDSNVIASLFEQFREYGTTRVDLFKLKALDTGSELISSAAVRAAVYLIISRTVLLLSIASAFLLGEWLGRYSYGFFIVTVAFALAGLVVYLRRDKWVKDPVARLIITKVLR